MRTLVQGLGTTRPRNKVEQGTATKRSKRMAKRLLVGSTNWNAMTCIMGPGGKGVGSGDEQVGKERQTGCKRERTGSAMKSGQQVKEWGRRLKGECNLGWK